MDGKKISISFHKERSILFTILLKKQTELGPTKIAEKIRDVVYRSLHKLGDAPSEETVISYLKCQRNIPFQTSKNTMPSWLQAAELTFPGCSRGFFHPLFNLLALNVRLQGAAEKNKHRDAARRLKQATLLRLASEPLISVNEHAAARSAGPSILDAEQPHDTLGAVHANMWVLPLELRKIFFAKPGLAHGWHRHYQSIEVELDSVNAFGGLEAVTAAYALWLEAIEIRDVRREHLAKVAILTLLEQLNQDKTLQKIVPTMREEIQSNLSWNGIVRYSADGLTLATFPATWHGDVLNWVYLSREHHRRRDDTPVRGPDIHDLVEARQAYQRLWEGELKKK